MKKKVILFLMGLAALGLLAGCGEDKEENKEHVTLGDYKSLSVEVDSPEMTEDDLRGYVEGLMAYFPAYEATDKTVVEEGDTVDIDFEGLKDGVAFEGGTAQGQKLTIGSHRFIDGFEDGLIGANVGDELELNLTFPESYDPNPDLAGQPVVFKVKVNAIVSPVEMSYDTLTDEYVSANFGYDTVQNMKDALTEQIGEQKRSSAESVKRGAIIERIRELNTVNSLPEGLLDERVAKYKKQMEDMSQAQYNMTLAEYLKANGQTEEEFNTNAVNSMKENIELELILAKIAEAEGIEIDEEGYQAFVDQMVANYGFADAQGLYDEYGEDFIRNAYLCNKTLDYLVEHAVVHYKQTEGSAPGNVPAEGGTEGSPENEPAQEGAEGEPAGGDTEGSPEGASSEEDSEGQQ